MFKWERSLVDRKLFLWSMNPISCYFIHVNLMEDWKYLHFMCSKFSILSSKCEQRNHEILPKFTSSVASIRFTLPSTSFMKTNTFLFFILWCLMSFENSLTNYGDAENISAIGFAKEKSHNKSEIQMFEFFRIIQQIIRPWTFAKMILFCSGQNSNVVKTFAISILVELWNKSNLLHDHISPFVILKVYSNWLNGDALYQKLFSLKKKIILSCKYQI